MYKKNWSNKCILTEHTLFTISDPAAKYPKPTSKKTGNFLLGSEQALMLAHKNSAYLGSSAKISVPTQPTCITPW